MVNAFELLESYLDQGRITVDPSRHAVATTYHDPCNYSRRSLQAFGVSYGPAGRRITRRCCPNLVEMYPGDAANYCCGAGGGSWAMSFREERVYYGRIKARQIKRTGAELVIAPCHNCRDQIKKSLNQEYDLGVKVKYLWELVADSLVLPGAPARSRGREE